MDEHMKRLYEHLGRLREIERENRDTPSADYDAGRVAGFTEALELLEKINA